MNYALDLSLRMERILERLQSETSSSNLRGSVSTSGLDGYSTGPTPGTYGLQYEGHAGNDQDVIPPYIAQPSSGTGTPTRPGTPGVSIPPFTGGPGGPSTPGGPNTPSPPLPTIEDLEERALQMAMEEGSFGFPLTSYVTTKGTRMISVRGVRGALPPLGGEFSFNPHWSHNFTCRR